MTDCRFLSRGEGFALSMVGKQSLWLAAGYGVSVREGVAARL